MAIIYFSVRPFEAQYPALGFVRAFAEAAMVGGLADWFAVTALFRHPMGIPIPHTAIIPRNKDRIGDTLAVFLRDNFLQPNIIIRRMYRLDIAGAAGRFLKSPAGGEGRMRLGASRLIGNVIASLDQNRLGAMVKGALREQIEKLDVATPMGQILEVAMAENRHGPIIDSLIRWAFRTLDANEHIIRQMVHDRANAIIAAGPGLTIAWRGMKLLMGSTSYWPIWLQTPNIPFAQRKQKKACCSSPPSLEPTPNCATGSPSISASLLPKSREAIR
ncbi:MAG: DUF445 domain-containing protein, partial [Parasphingorhabdus sp.]|nr:DUF445 domain-containing protein [Parasphingorhabdus sp.]